ncbi:MAG: hypothetical protein HC933_22405 [Pleurocapsa sp. SU_196_0]|nr:hypothetical protein [Pleurocapsa sp. SU_196_0]
MIASLPSKQELRGQVVGVLMSKLQEFVGILEAKVEKDGGGSSEPPASTEAAAPAEAEAPAVEAEAAPEAPAAEA